MRQIGVPDPRELAPVPPDTVVTAILAAGTAAAFDYPFGTSIGGIMRISGQTTGGSNVFAFYLSPDSTKATLPTTNVTSTQTVTGTTNYNIGISAPTMYQVPGVSTGFSVISSSVGIVTGEFWKK